MKPMVLVLTTTFPARPGDGIPPFVLDLCLELSHDFDITVVTPRIPGAPARQQLGSVSVERFAYFPRPFERLAFGATLANLRAQPWRIVELTCLLVRFHWVARRAIARLDPALVHAHWLLPTGLHAVGLFGTRRPPVVITAHGVDVFAMANPPLDRIRRFVIRRCHHLVAVSSEMAERLSAIEPTAPVEVVPMGANLAEIPAAFERAPEAGHIAFVGRLAEKKGVSTLLDALALTPDLRLTIAGDGPDRSRLEAQVEGLRLGARVDLIGHADRAQVYELLSRCEMLAIPSVVASDGDQEGTPVVLAEAVSLGVPVVASRLGGLADQLDDETGWLVDPGHADQLAAALDEMHRSPVERERRAANAKRDLSSVLSLERTAASYATSYAEAL
ncbi:MAG: glycosyltransferase family 4 protein [Actinomycetia bacterium]|nr:glycosyltransferase family 4 protein [Actinomycetes bacterium]